MDDSDKRNRIFFSDHSIVNHLRFFKRKGKKVMNKENMRLWDNKKDGLRSLSGLEPMILMLFKAMENFRK